MMTQTRFENEAEKAVVLIFFFFEPVAGESFAFLHSHGPVQKKEGKKSKKKQKGRGAFLTTTNEREKERQKDEGREDKKEIAPQKRATKSARIKTRRLNTSR
jgi:hypothetical protein